MKRFLALFFVLLVMTSCAATENGGDYVSDTLPPETAPHPSTSEVSDADDTAEISETVFNEAEIITEPYTDCSESSHPKTEVQTLITAQLSEPEAHEEVPEVMLTDGGVHYYTNIRKYLKYIRAEELALVNKSNSLGEDFIPVTYEDSNLNENAYFALVAMKTEMKKIGVVCPVETLCYRSFSDQYALYEYYYNLAAATYPRKAEREWAKIANQRCAVAGQSEHQLGLCADMDITEQTFDWMKDNAHRFGFILRYPEGKEKITGYQFERWHWRFVGRDAATEIYKKGWTLEEFLKAYPEKKISLSDLPCSTTSAPSETVPPETEPEESVTQTSDTVCLSESNAETEPNRTEEGDTSFTEPEETGDCTAIASDSVDILFGD